MAHLDQRQISLSPELAASVDEAVANGEYASANEVVAEALGRWKDERNLFGYTLEELRALVQEGIDSGPSQDGESSLDRIKERAAARVAASAR